MIQEELIKVFKYIVKKCDMLINNDDYKADDYTQDTVEDIAELCNHILDGDYGKLVEVKEVDLEKIINDYFKDWKFDDELDIMVKPNNYSASFTDLKEIAKYFFGLGIKAAQKDE